MDLNRESYDERRLQISIGRGGLYTSARTSVMNVSVRSSIEQPIDLRPAHGIGKALLNHHEQ